MNELIFAVKLCFHAMRDMGKGVQWVSVAQAPSVLSLKAANSLILAMVSPE